VSYNVRAATLQRKNPTVIILQKAKLN